MGNVKLAEDNMEIMIERQIIRESKMKERRARNEVRASVETNETIVQKSKKQYPPMRYKNGEMAAEKGAKYKDKILFCKCCGQRFLFSAHAQKEYAKKGWHEPKRCKPCRDINNIINLMNNSF